jgi:hypothetical protein
MSYTFINFVFTGISSSAYFVLKTVLTVECRDKSDKVPVLKVPKLYQQWLTWS